MISLKRFLTMGMAKNIYLSFTGAGVVVFMFYCMRIGFFPTGLSLSDVLFFLLVITSFSLFLVFFGVYWYSMSVIISYLFMKSALLIFTKNKKKKGLYTLKGTYKMAKRLKIYDPILAHILISLIGGIVVFSGVKSGKIEAQSVILSLFLTAFFITLIPNVYFSRKVKRESKKNVAISIIGVIFTLFFIVSDMAPLLSDAGMSYIGVRKPNATIFLQGIDLEMARKLTGDQKQTCFTGGALFTGVGTNSLIVINHKRLIVSNRNMSLSF